MHESAYRHAQEFYDKYCKNDIEQKKILDIGSLDVNGTLKPIFKEGDYIGLDAEKGKNVDVVGTSHKIPFSKNTFDIVISSSCFEHDDMFWVSFLEMCRVLKPNGYMYINAPSNGPEHRFPVDNWRFYQDSWSALEKWGQFKKHNIKLVESYIGRPSSRATGFGWLDSVGIYQLEEAH